MPTSLMTAAGRTTSPASRASRWIQPIRSSAIRGEALTTQTSGTSNLSAEVVLVVLEWGDAIARQDVQELRAAHAENLRSLALRDRPQLVPLRDGRPHQLLGELRRALAQGRQGPLGDGHRDLDAHPAILAPRGRTAALGA